MTTATDVGAASSAPEILQTVVFVEDKSDDYLAAREQLAKLQLRNPIHRAHNVAGLMQYLERVRRSHPGDGTALPCVIIIELKLPQASGLDGQAMLRGSAHFRGIPIITISDNERANVLKRAVELGADGYLIKPFKGADFKKLAQELKLPLGFGDSEKKAAGAKSTVKTSGGNGGAKSNSIASSVAKKLGLFTF